MKGFAPEQIRNVALVGHGGSGKTSLAEALLFRAGVINRMGRVEDGSTVCDHDPEEHEKGFSLALTLAPFEWKGHKVNLIDTPGFPDFLGDVYAALRVADLAVFIVSAVEGVEVQTEVIWREAARLEVPRMIFVNKLDRDRASFTRTLEGLREKFGAGVAPLELPIGEEAAFHGVADLLTDKAYLYDSGHSEEAEIPDELQAVEHEVRDNLVEGIVVADDDLLERYLEGDIPSAAELEKTLAHGVGSASVFPVTCGAATGPIAVDRLADFLCEIGPPPTARPPIEVTAGDTTADVACDPAADPLAFVFKTVADRHVGHISVFKVVSGTVEPDDHLTNTRSGIDARMHGLFTLVGKEHETVPNVPAGDIAAVAKLSDTETNDTLAPKGKPVTIAPVDKPAPVLAVAIKAATPGEEDKLATGLHRLQEEDPTLIVERSDETHQTLLWGNGETHLNIARDRLDKKYGVAVDTEDIRVAYRETITRTAEAEGKHKKQTGGRGQFGVAFIRLEPQERGIGFEFSDEVVGGAIPRGLIPAVEKGIAETMRSGGVYGYPVVDVKAAVYDGKFHQVDSDEMSFKTAARIGFRAAMAKAGPVLLEPISLVTIIVPIDSQGDVMGDLNSRRGRVQGTEAAGNGEQEITALVPASEILRYAIDLRSMTGGRGRFTAEHDHYDILPSNLVDQVKREMEQED